MAVNLNDQDFLDAVAAADIGDVVEGMTIEYKETTYAHFPFHQRIFEPGAILHKVGDNTRVFIPADLIGITPTDTDPANFIEYQTGAPDRGIPRDGE